MKAFLVLLLLITVTTTGLSQNLLLFHKNRYREQLYQAGDVITIRLKGHREKFSAMIREIEDTVLVFKDYRVRPENISDIYVDDKTRRWFILRYKYARIFMIGGSGYILLNAVNDQEIKEETWILGGSLIGAGLIAQAVIGKRMKVKARRKLMILRDSD
jgi:hypothetical protein